MLRTLLSAGLVFLQLSAALAMGAANGPPTQQWVRVDPSGAVDVYYQASLCVMETHTKTVQKKIPVTEEYTEDVNGQVVKKTRTKYETATGQVNYSVAKPVFQTQMRKTSVERLKAFETDGKPISVEGLKRRLAKETLVVVSTNDRMISASYAGLFKPGTVILAFQQAAASPLAPPAPSAPVASASAPVESPTPVPSPAPPAPAPSPGPAAGLALADLTILPSAAQPQFLFARREGADQIRLRRLSEHSYVTSGHKVQIQGAEKRMVPVQMTQTVQQGETTTISGQDLQCFDAQGSAIAIDRVNGKLGREGTVLYSGDGEPVHPFWLRNVRPSMLVLVGPQLPCGYGMPMMAPMPASVPPPATAQAPLKAPAAAAPVSQPAS